jgi:hypothetical protein
MAGEVNYVQRVAERICALVPGQSVPNDADDLFLIYAVLALAKGTAVNRSDVHDAWSAWMTMRGEQHDAVRPLVDLPEETRAEDDPFVAAIRAVATEESRGS